MTKIKALYENGEQFYPLTHIEAVKGLVNATEQNSGLMSKEDKIKLNNFNAAGSSALGSVFYKEIRE
ncbi:hypothetical protein B5C00_09055 [Staphylococcus delphini]|uniref:hypothetical protein n=1 Tax=Staphylococcus delphini TaxID=53344 RepID=UPI000BBCC275|nr:hypothetical protein [Staphylococcus delphini]EMC0274943.1 hypothetical protein [Staphylococcus pseudintermedius]PCF33143.1 hypothetical protein B5C00_09055 [Staphylococcus delphini]PCF83016.1 hypothetical protein B4W69_11020 [Staphylococcus delphini]